ncbi:MAG: hypothetical protein QM638_22510 [Nocardioides sp.]|uniref:hypothetical protein n=1 Tax=Nocardioides sp. TaxID=35761 RepID=UPI0039E32C81
MTSSAPWNAPSRPRPSRCHRPRRTITALVAATGLVLLAGCGNGTGPSVASLSPSGATGSSSPSASGSVGTTRSALAYAECMRAHGVTDFPDPNADGEIQLDTEPGSDLEASNPTFKAADAACKSLLPNQGKQPAHLKEDNLKYARCMRAHGVTDFPDPAADGTLQLKSTPGGDLDPTNPTFKSANAACKSYLPHGGEGSSLNSTDG